MKRIPIQLFKAAAGIATLAVALAAPLSVMGQQIVFNDTFSGSTINGASTNSGTTTATSTGYDIASGKSCTATTVSAGHLALEIAATSSGTMEAQAVFAPAPISLVNIGDYIELQYTFTDTTNVFNGRAAQNEQMFVGLYNSGGVLPVAVSTTGTNLWNSGLSGSRTESANGGVKGWIGYDSANAYGFTGNAGWNIYTRPSQFGANDKANNLNQTLMQSGSGGFGGNVTLGTLAPGLFPWPVLLVGTQYTCAYRITLSAAGTLVFTNTLYIGADVNGTVITNVSGTATGANVITTNFDALGIGWKAACNPTTQTTNDVNRITVLVGTAAGLPGPMFYVKGSGACGGITVGLDGSVATNSYWLYTNGIPTGQITTGTGSAISFGQQDNPGTYTVVASNSVTGTTYPMIGQAIVLTGSPFFSVQPASVVCATNSMAVFSGTAVGSLLGYQWYKGGVPIADGGDVAGSRTPNLMISPAQTADVGSYYLVATNPCGYSITTAPPVTLTLQKANDLVWQGGNPNNTWDLLATSNFLNSAVVVAYTNGDNVTFDDSSSSTIVNLVGTNLAPTLIRVNGSQNYAFGGDGIIAGSARLAVNTSGSLTLTNINTYTGGTVVSNGSTLIIGGRGGALGSVRGAIAVSNATVHYLFNGAVTVMNENVSGTGNLIYELASSVISSITLDPGTMTNNAFAGTVEIKPGVRLDVGAAYGLPGTNIIVENSSTTLAGQLYVHGSFTNTTALSLIGRGPGSPVDTPKGFGALRLNGGWAGPITIAGVDVTYGVTTIGGSGGTAMILGNISDGGNGYEVEYYGGTIQVGPTTGVNTYGVNRITEALSGSGSTSVSTIVVALNSNAFSTNTLNMNGQAILRLNGNNLEFNNLIDESDTYAQSNIPPVIQNFSSNAPAILTVGRDNNSQTFHGVFGDGASQPLGLTKVGSGTLSLSGDSTNTGSVTVNGGILALVAASGSFQFGFPFVGSGSFSNTARFAVSSGVLDVSGRSDGTLTLNSGQTLSGNGAVQGNVVALTGSTINPGNSIGTLTLNNNLTLQGQLLMDLNRTNAQKNDLLNVSGTAAFSGGILAVTNIGPALHANDSFTLFGGARTFGGFNLQTNDYVNNVKYAWVNTVATDGKITVASVTSLVNTNPPRMIISQSGNTLNLGWPTNLGWTLLTNSAGLTASNQWFPYAGSALVTNVSINMDSTKTNVFFRMVYPYP